MTSRGCCHFLPPYLLDRVATAAGEPADGPRRRTLQRDATLRAKREQVPGVRRREEAARAAARTLAAELGEARTATAPSGRPAVPPWVVYSAGNTEQLPGERVRGTGDPASGDREVDEAADGLVAVLELYAQRFARRGYDGAGAETSTTVHYGTDYANAFWDGEQLVFGDGDGEIFHPFTCATDVLGHEFTHAVIDHTAGLVYRDQPGALNESVADVFASCLRQRLAGHSAAEGDWLIGSDLFLPGVQARGLRDLANPGTAYDDPNLGQDPQPGHMDDFVTTEDDNGGVHINSGIPNRAFHLAATGIGGDSATGAGQVWYAALTGGRVGADTDFAGFAAATIAAAGEHAEVVREAWQSVGVTPASPAPEPSPPAPEGPGRVRIRRSGGVTGLVHEQEVDLGGVDQSASAARALLARLGGPSTDAPRGADTYQYRITLPTGHVCTVAEGELGEDQRTLLRRALGE